MDIPGGADSQMLCQVRENQPVLQSVAKNVCLPCAMAQKQIKTYAQVLQSKIVQSQAWQIMNM